jgi:hypothetical protein
LIGPRDEMVIFGTVYCFSFFLAKIKRKGEERIVAALLEAYYLLLPINMHPRLTHSISFSLSLFLSEK